MPTTRAQVHVPTRYNGVAPALIGDALFSNPSNEGVNTSDDVASDATVEVVFKSMARLVGLWYADIPLVGLRHVFRFEQNGTGFLRTLAQIGDVPPKYLPFTYTFDVASQTVTLTMSPLDPTQLPYLQATYHSTLADSGTITLSIKAEQLHDTELQDPNNIRMKYKPTEKLILSSSPWPDQLFPDATVFYGRFASISFAKS